MKLLILTQKLDINDPILGFFHKWIEGFSKKFEKVTVICLEKGEYNLPSNVTVYSLGKESIVSRNSYLVFRLKYISNFYKYIWKERKNYDSVFVHMNPEYIVIGGIIWRLLNKKISLWYTHRQKNLKLWLAEKLSHNIFTSSKYSFTLPSSKVQIVGHGIDTDLFGSIIKTKSESNLKIFIHVGRITRIKNCHILIEVAKILKENWQTSFRINFIGEPIFERDILYKKILESLVKEYGLEDNVRFIGSVAPTNMPKYYSEAAASFNLAPTGGVDKSVLESIAAKVPAFFSNESFIDVYSENKDNFMFKEADPADLAKKVVEYFNLSSLEQEVLTQKMSKKVEKAFSVTTLIDKIYFKLNEAS